MKRPRVLVVACADRWFAAAMAVVLAAGALVTWLVAPR